MIELDIFRAAKLYEDIQKSSILRGTLREQDYIPWDYVDEEIKSIYIDYIRVKQAYKHYEYLSNRRREYNISKGKSVQSKE